MQIEVGVDCGDGYILCALAVKDGEPNETTDKVVGELEDVLMRLAREHGLKFKTNLPSEFVCREGSRESD